MKIGLLTVHCSVNYGASLQAYALSKFIKNLGHEVKIIDYRPKYFTSILDYNHKNDRKHLKTRLKLILLHNRIYSQFDAFTKFENMYFDKTELLEKEDLMKISKDFDVFICGSDQIWNPLNVNFDSSFFFDFADKSAIKASYAASIGQDELDEDCHKFLTDNLKLMDFISIREDIGVNLAEKLTTKSITQNIDPVFLLDKEDWEDIENKIELPKKYVFVYTIGMQELPFQIASDLKSKNDLKCITIQFNAFKHKVTDLMMDKYGPREFLHMIRNAEYVVTNSFHGLALSILFKKKVIPFCSLDRNSRIESLLRVFNLTGIQISNFDEYKNKDFDVYWNKIIDSTEIINNERNSSKNYLKKIGL